MDHEEAVICGEEAFPGWSVISNYRDGHAVSAPVQDSGHSEKQAVHLWAENLMLEE